MLYLLSNYYEKVYITKPLTSRPQILKNILYVKILKEYLNLN